MNRNRKQVRKVALITGAARRIGAVIAGHLHQAGYRVAIHYHQSEAEANSLALQFNQQQADSARIFCQNLSSLEKGEQLIEPVINWAGRLDLLVNNASQFTKNHFENFDETLWHTLFKLNTQVPYQLSQAALPYLKKQQGVIVNITDIHAEIPLKEYAIYCQTKAALLMQTRALAKEFAPLVRVNAVAPGSIAWPEKENRLSEQMQQKIIAETPLKRHGHPDFIAKAVLSIANNEFITGQVLNVDGGRSLR
ncbi:pteridine reductase [Legionella quinlivanii]|uniref:Pteridine reductase n=1 Tax=Legionella quinlivanii TaxID=45073 RepID=A0A0W0Y5M5_9GAMM|nr:pteridine reductase [Legionella quinlivanii]KTD52106.1 pteridine reductase [Legionella quinlivanii]SEF78331.1 pteridine reductase [Legionella quinlivanii DSM 21216]STY12397.1 pteridine reductase 1 [Legionella quinlivanii]